ncbi:MAG TPA: hypothetical protein VGR15_05520 [Bacteroidota bacterium]|jgi:hypothetical protein|nr:hypothetical protein [Bacteroidota bacterium]
MSTEDYSKQQKEENEQGFPIQLKLLLAVIALGVLAIALKAIGVF